MRLASAGAHVVVTDIDLSGARSVAEAIIDSEGMVQRLPADWT